MDKIIYQDSCDEFTRAMEHAGESFVNLIETEAGVKSAASDLIDRNLLEKYRPEDDSKVLIHLIGMGNSDQYGFNRNGDYFAGDVLEKRAGTFVTHGKMYREHRNKDPKKSIGEIKYAAYDPKGMQRVEILVHMDKDKAPEEYEMAKEGKALNFSMSCRVPNDRCSCCGNEAKTVANYCDCLKSHMGQYMDGFNKYAFAYNDEPTFFDISRVKNPADRIARHLDYLFSDKSNDLYKSASVNNTVIPGAVAAMEEGVNLNTFNLQECNFITKLAAVEEYINDRNTVNKFYTEDRANALLGSYPFAMMEKMSSEELQKARNVKPGTLFGELAKRACILSFPAFCQYISGREEALESPLVKKAALILPGIFRDMMGHMMSMTPMTDSFCCDGEYSRERDPGHHDLVQNFMDKAEEKFSSNPEHVKNRVLTIVIRIKLPGGSDGDVEEKMNKAASSDVPYQMARELANAYGQYQLQALSDIKANLGNEFNEDYMCDLIAGSNYAQVFDR